MPLAKIGIENATSRLRSSVTVASAHNRSILPSSTAFIRSPAATAT